MPTSEEQSDECMNENLVRNYSDIDQAIENARTELKSPSGSLLLPILILTASLFESSSLEHKFIDDVDSSNMMAVDDDIGKGILFLSECLAGFIGDEFAMSSESDTYFPSCNACRLQTPDFLRR